MTHSVHLVVRGRVQGVGFRYFVQRRADSMGIDGWVRNRPDGAVEMEAEGPKAELECLVGAVSRGPSGARVTAVEQEWSVRVPCLRGFRVTG
ncbi:MAG: acylphosphatase [Candidatus Eiseniibacteriota bacterium]